MEATTYRILLFVLFALAAFACFLSAITLVSASEDSDTIMNVNWSYGKSGSTKIYTGIYRYVVNSKGGSAETTSSLDYSACNADWCDDCDSAMKATIAFAVFTFVFTIPSIITNFLRTTEAGNTNQNKLVGAITAIIAIALAILTLIIFGAGCQEKIEDASSGVDWEMGVCFGMLVTVIVLEIINAVCNFVIPAKAAE